MSNAGCTNHSCIVDPPKGMGTNGMCHCLDPLGKEKARALVRKIQLMKATIAAQQKMIVAYRTGKMILPDSVFETLEKARAAGLIK